MVNKRVGGLRHERREVTTFKYKPPPKGHIKREADRRVGRFDGIFKSSYDSWRAKEGDNTIRVLPGAWEGHDDYAYTVFVHAFVGPDEGTYLCRRKMSKGECPICDEVALLKKGGEADDAKKMDWKEQKIAWIISRDERGKPKPYLWAISAPLYKDINALCVNSKTGSTIFIDHPDEGYDIVLRRTGTRLQTRYLPHIDRDSSPLSDDPDEMEDLLAHTVEHPIPECLHYYDAEYLENVVSGRIEKGDEQLDARRGEDDGEERPRRHREEPEEEERPRRSRREEPEEEERPRTRSRREPEEPEEPEERPRRRREEPEPELNDRLDDVPRHSRREEPEEEEQERPRRRREEPPEEPEERPRRRREEPDDDPPPRRRARASDIEPEEEEERPRRKKPAEEEEERPRRRTRD